MVELPREYKDTTPTWTPILIGGAFGTLGLVGICVGIGALFLGAELHYKLMPLGMGALFLFVGVGQAIHLHWNYIRHTINCTPAGFSVTSENRRRGTRREEYRWDEVTSTDYEEIKSRSRKRRRTYDYFSVKTVRGRAFKVDHNQSAFDELITVFNEQTPHLPYMWIPNDSFANTLLRAFSSRPRYNKVPRPPRTGPPPLPPPLPPPI